MLATIGYIAPEYFRLPGYCSPSAGQEWGRFVPVCVCTYIYIYVCACVFVCVCVCVRFYSRMDPRSRAVSLPL